MSGLLKISEAAVLGLHAMLFISQHGDRKVSTHEIAAAHGVSENHLAKVMQRLVKAGLASSVRGPGGGFELRREPKDITLLELYELFDGPVFLKNCLFELPVCGNTYCVFGDLLGDVNRLVMDYLSNTTLGNIVDRNETKTA
ncbi:MAG: Rrf2 family transcriptional regulator [Candidatus Latescibacteria bacterium]|nr:Rrf2 family transcriptional regulator [Candidatus Latescibacterota bacterium]